ncbi:hypothetical protein B0H13DRAFT_2347232 [Mycena leptocephala]|nr:hypothetical protein B0H13DRAFT_2347232 [Mycena leptocephala]
MPDQQPTPTVLASAVLPIMVHVDSAAEAFSTIDVPPTSAVDAEAAPPADDDDAVVAPFTVDVDSAAESSSATDARPTNVVDAEAAPKALQAKRACSRVSTSDLQNRQTRLERSSSRVCK